MGRGCEPGATPSFAEHWNKVRVGENGADNPLGARMLMSAGLGADARRACRSRPISKASELVKWGTVRDCSSPKIFGSWY